MFFSKQLTKRLPVGIVAGLAAIFLTACSDTGTEADSQQTATQTSQSPVLEVYKRAACGCCRKWMAHLKDNDFQTTAHNRNDLSALKVTRGIQPRYHSCHTAISKDGYVFEGHIPAKYIQSFLRDRPEGAIGLAVPAMPSGSPGMEAGSNFTPYRVVLLKSDGSSETYARIKTQKEQY